MRSIVADSGPLIALFNRGDAWHLTVAQWLERNPAVRILSTWPVVTEVCAMLSGRIGNAAALDFLTWVERGALALDAPSAASFHAVVDLTRRYRDLPFDFADASVAELAVRERVDSVLTIDSDFAVYRDARGRALRSVLALDAARRPSPGRARR